MCSDRMRALATDLEDAVYLCGLEAGKNKGSVGLKTLTQPVIRRATLLREIALIEQKADLWKYKESE